MAKTALGMTKAQWVQFLGGGAVAFGATGVVAPRALGAAYSVPSSPHTTQLLRLFGSRMLAIAAWTYTARTKEETDRLLAVAAAMNALDVLTALAAMRTTGGATAGRAALTSAFFGTLAFAVRSLDD
jgi:hypothetical protein